MRLGTGLFLNGFLRFAALRVASVEMTVGFFYKAFSIRESFFTSLRFVQNDAFCLFLTERLAFSGDI